MSKFFINRPIVAMVISIVTCIVGLISLSRLPISEYPNVSPTLIQVTSTYRGAAAEAVMESVATPIETKVNGVDKLLYMQSYNANDGKMTLNVYFDVGTDVDIMQVNTQNRVGQAQVFGVQAGAAGPRGGGLEAGKEAGAERLLRPGQAPGRQPAPGHGGVQFELAHLRRQRLRQRKRLPAVTGGTVVQDPAGKGRRGHRPSLAGTVAAPRGRGAAG